MYQALYRKYRPKVFDDVIGQGHITEILKNQLISGRLSHAYLFTGTRGTGKTTCAKLLARAVNCESPEEGNPCNRCPACLGIENGSIPDVLEIDAASNNGVDSIRALRDDSIYSPATVKKRVYIIDEVHMLSTAAFNALLKIMEEPPAHLMFILATTELNKIPATILSRCQRFSFKRIGSEDIAELLLRVAEKENIGLDKAAASLLARLSDGAMRDALSLMDQCAVSGGQLSVEDIYQTLGLAGNIKTAALMNHIARGQTAEALALFSELYASGKDVSALFGELCSLGRDLLILKTAGDKIALLGGYDDETLKKLSKAFTFEGLMYTVSALQDALSAFPKSANRRTEAELCLMKVCDPAASGAVEAVAARLAKLETELDTLKAGGLAAAPAAMTEVSPAPPAPMDEIRPQAYPEPVDEEAPPWDDSDAPPLTDGDAPPPAARRLSPEKAAAPAPVRPIQPERKPSAEPSGPEPPSFGGPKSEGPKSGGPSADFWPKLVDGIRSRIDIVSGMYLANAELCSAAVQSGELVISAANPFILGIISKQELSDLIAAEAGKLTGAPLPVRFAIAGETAVSGDKLGALVDRARGLDNIKII